MREFETHRLPSGMTVHLLEQDEPSTHVLMQIGIGKLDDPKGAEGTAHVIEHMLAGIDEPEHGFIGRRWLAEDRILHQGASTGSIFTNFISLCEKGHEENLFRKMREVLYDEGNLHDLDHHLQCVLNERGYRGSDGDEAGVLSKVLSHPRLTSATSLPNMTTLMTFSLGALRDHHRKWYTFGNSNLMLVSPRPWSELEPLVTECFGAENERSGGLPPQRKAAAPIRQSGTVHIKCKPDQSTVTMRMLTGLTIKPTRGLVTLTNHLLRTRLLDGLRVVFRISYSPQVQIENRGVGNILRIKAKAPGAMTPTLRDAMTGPLDDTSWVKDYLDPVREELAAEMSLSITRSAPALLKNFSVLRQVYVKAPTLAETLTEINALKEEDIQAYLKKINDVGFYTTLE